MDICRAALQGSWDDELVNSSEAPRAAGAAGWMTLHPIRQLTLLCFLVDSWSLVGKELPANHLLWLTKEK